VHKAEIATTNLFKCKFLKTQPTPWGQSFFSFTYLVYSLLLKIQMLLDHVTKPISFVIVVIAW